MSTKTLTVTHNIHEYMLKHLNESAVLTELRQVTAKLPGAGMQISPEQGQFMALLVQILGAKRCIEIGTFTGYSALVVAEALPTDGKIIACDTDEKILRLAQQYWAKAGVDKKIDLRIGPGLDTLEKLIADSQQDSFDFIFIDADKANYINYYQLALTLIRPGGVIALDNMLWSGKVADTNIDDKQTKAIRQCNDFIQLDSRVTSSLLPIGDGLLLVVKR